MANKKQIWGIHMGAHVGADPIEKGYVAIGWKEMGDYTQLPKTRDGVKEVVQQTYPNIKPGAVPVWGGVIYRFLSDMSVGDLVIYPSKSDRMVNIGRISGDYFYDAKAIETYPNRRTVEWLAHLPRDQFSQAALYEIGSAMTLFSVKNYSQEFLQALTPDTKAPQNLVNPPPEDDRVEDDDSVTSEATSKAAETTSDFIIRRLKNHLSPYEFEHFVAHLLECMGYHARVTEKSGDGGVDIIAHRDELGFEPPIIKVQCKQITGTSGEPDVNQLVGTIGDGEYALFVNLGSFSRPAKSTENNKAKLRLIDGEQLVELILENYSKLAPRYRTILPLKQIYVADI